MSSRKLQSGRGTGSNLRTNKPTGGGNAKSGSVSFTGKSVFVRRALIRSAVGGSCCGLALGVTSQ